MNEAAYEQLIDRLGVDGVLSPASVDAILAAADGPAVLEAHLDGSPAPTRRADATTASVMQPARVYLEHIAVENFRGVGPSATLQVAAGPGLTLVVGRNGCGKSTFAEGLELLLTGTNLRWADKTKVWREGWRNLHGTGRTRIAARFRVDGQAEPLEVRRSWEPDSTLEAGDPISVSGPRVSWEALAWDRPLEQFRPLLSYNELGAMFSTRAAALYDALSAVLGMQEFDELAAVLRQARLPREKTAKTEKQERQRLVELAQRSEDRRADGLQALLAERDVALEQVQQLAVSDSAISAGQGNLAALASLTVPARSDIEQAFAALAGSVAEVQALEQTDADRLDALARLLDDALSFHARHAHDQTCPVCGAPDRLDPGWSIRSQAEVQQLKRSSGELRAAREHEQAARRQIAGLFGAETPAVLRGGLAVGIDVDAADDAWAAWSEALAAGMADAARATALGRALQRAADDARAEQRRRDLDWQPVRSAAVGWLATARAAIRDKQAVAILKAAGTWMADCTAALREERLAPVVQAAQDNWRQLRHESNVALGDITLRKSGQQRYASFDVSVDGEASSAFGVMSQGELSALAVSIFLPRAALPQSPFGFMVIDDPVQSMDPAKVDGLARVLARAAEERQVIVFTHDERLPEAVRRLAIDARTISVKRRAQSKVELVAGRPPSDRYIGEAIALAKTDGLAAEVRARVIPGFCRSAVEAACEARIRRQRIEAGVPHATVEGELQALTSLTTRLAAAFGLAVAQGQEINSRLRAIGGDDAVIAIRQIKAGTHELVGIDHLALIERTKRIVKAIDPS